MPRRPHPRALATLGLLAVAATACGGGGDDAEVLGEQVTREVSASASVEAESLATTTTAPPETTTTTAPPATTTTTAPPSPADPMPEPVQAPRGSVAAPEHVRLTLTLERTDAPAGERLTGTLTAENTSAEPVDITHPTTCPTAAGLYSDGSRVSEGQACGQAVTPDQLGPGEVRAWPVEIRTGGTAPGAYDAFAGVRVRGGTWYAAPVTVTVT